MKRKTTHLSGLLLCLSALALAGSVAGTLAFYNATDKTEVNLTAATVDVQISSVELGDLTLAYPDHGASVTLDTSDYSITGTNLVPGDTFDVTVNYTNNSTIPVKYYLSAPVIDGVTVTATQNGKKLALTNGHTEMFATTVAKEAIASVTYTFIVGDDFNSTDGVTGNFAATAYQGNADVYFDYKIDDTNKLFRVNSAYGFETIYNLFNNNLDTYINQGWTLQLDADLDLSSVTDFTGFGKVSGGYVYLNVDGNGHTISNLTINGGHGFFNNLGGSGTKAYNEDVGLSFNRQLQYYGATPSIHDVNFDNVTVDPAGTNTSSMGEGNCVGTCYNGVTAKNLTVNGVTQTENAADSDHNNFLVLSKTGSTLRPISSVAVTIDGTEISA